MIPRKMVGQRKGAPAVTIAVHGGGPPDPAESQAGDTASGAEGDSGISDNEPETVQCPKCGCEFDPNAVPEYEDVEESGPPAQGGGGDVAAMVAQKLNGGEPSA